MGVSNFDGIDVTSFSGGSQKAFQASGISTIAPPSMLPKFRVAKAKALALTSVAKVAFVSDSKFLGTGAGDGAGNYNGAASRNLTAAVATLLGPIANRQTFVGLQGLPNPAELTLYDPRQTPAIPGDWVQRLFTLGGNTYASPAASTTVRTFVTDPGVITDSVLVLVRQNSGAGTMRVSDGTTNVDISMTNATDQMAMVNFTGFTRGAGKTFTVGRSAGGQVYPYAFIAYDSKSPQIVLLNAGAASSATGDWVNPAGGVDSPMNALKGFAPDLTFVGLGTNNMAPTSLASRFTTPEVYGTHLQTIYDAAAVSGDVVFVVPTRPSPANERAALYDSYMAVMRQVAATNNAMVLDFAARLGTFDVANGIGFMRDQLHETGAGYGDEGAVVSSILSL